VKASAAGLSTFGSLSGHILKSSQPAMGPLNRSDNKPHAGQQGIRLFDSEKLHK
jgi:hypothetical protein